MFSERVALFECVTEFVFCYPATSNCSGSTSARGSINRCLVINEKHANVTHQLHAKMFGLFAQIAIQSSWWSKTSLLLRYVLGLILGRVRSDTASPTARNRCDVSVLPRRQAAEKDWLCHSIQALAQYRKYNEDLILNPYLQNKLPITCNKLLNWKCKRLRETAK